MKCIRCPSEAVESLGPLCPEHLATWWDDTTSSSERLTVMIAALTQLRDELRQEVGSSSTPSCDKECYLVFHMTGHRHVLGCAAYDPSPGCPTCGSPKPELHPSLTQVCPDAFHTKVKT